MDHSKYKNIYNKNHKNIIMKLDLFEKILIESVLEENLEKSLIVYDDFFSNNFKDNSSISLIKNINIDLFCNISTNSVNLGVDIFQAKGKAYIFNKLINDSNTNLEIFSYGKKFIKASITQISDAKKYRKNPYVYKAINYMKINMENQLTLEEVAKYCNISKCYLCTLFKKHLNNSFSNYLNEIRIEKAKFILKHSNVNIIDLSYDLGYSSQSYFSTQFKKQTGLTPKEYMKN